MGRVGIYLTNIKEICFVQHKSTLIHLVEYNKQMSTSGILESGLHVANIKNGDHLMEIR